MEFHELPIDLNREILRRSSARTLCNFSAVSKHFSTYASDETVWQVIFHRECRVEDANDAGYADAGQFFEGDATWRSKYQKWCENCSEKVIPPLFWNLLLQKFNVSSLLGHRTEMVFFSWFGIRKMLNAVDMSEQNIRIFSNMCRNAEFYHPSFGRPFEDIVLVLARRLDASRQKDPENHIQSNKIYAYLWGALVDVFARCSKPGFTPYIVRNAARLRSERNMGPSVWYSRWNFAVSFLSLCLSTASTGTYLLTFAPIWALWFLWSPDTVIDQIHASLTALFMGRSMLWTSAFSAVFHLAGAPWLSHLVMGPAAFFGNLLYYLGWIVRSCGLYFKLLQPESRTSFHALRCIFNAKSYY
jgi:hypothetical protein